MWKLNSPRGAVLGLLKLCPLHGHFFTQRAQKRIDVREHRIWAAELPEKNRKIEKLLNWKFKSDTNGKQLLPCGQ